MPRTKRKVKSIVKTKVISARVTETVHELLHRQAEDAGMTLSEFAAQMLMKGRVNTSYVFYVHPDEIEAITREFAAIGNNLNQIAAFFNSGGMHLAQRYVDYWPEMRGKNVGLLLWGGVGTGKSFMAGCIANALMEQEVAVYMTNFARIMNELNSAFAGRNEVVDRLCRYPLLVIDDFGMERGTEYALEQIYNIIDSRYRSRKPLIVTTNLTLTELKNPQDTAHARIYDRLLELCTPIACTGPSMRKDIGQAKLNLLKTLLA